MADWTEVERLFVGAAYGLTWVVLLLYAILLARRENRIRAALDDHARSEGGQP